MSFADNLKAARESKNLSRLQLAAALSISVAAYAHYETGAREPNLTNLVAICRILEISADSLLDVHPPAISSPKDNYNDDNFEVIRAAIENAGYNMKELQDVSDDTVLGPKIGIYKYDELIAVDGWYRMQLIISRIINEAYESVNLSISKQIELLYNSEVFSNSNTPEKLAIVRYAVDFDFLFTSDGAPYAKNIDGIVNGNLHNPFTNTARTDNAEAWQNYKKSRPELKNFIQI